MPRTWVVAEIVTAALMNTHVRDNLRYLKGIDGVPTIQNGLIVDNSLGTEYLTVPSLTTTQRDALTPVNGMVIYNSTLTVFQRREAGAWISYNNLATMVISSQAQGDIFYASSATVIARLGAGTDGYFLKTQGAGANPIWTLVTSIAIVNGSYAGDDSANRAIAHGLGVAPKAVFITPRTNSYNMLMGLRAQAQLNSASGLWAVTAADATNFYVGNATSYPNSGNGSGITYDWVALT